MRRLRDIAIYALAGVALVALILWVRTTAYWDYWYGVTP